jgi:hypothetical protein
LQSNEDQGGIRAEGEDEVVYPLPIRKEVPPLKEAFVELPVVIQEKAETQEHQTISKKRFPVLSEVFHRDGLFVSPRHIFPSFASPLVNTPRYTLGMKPLPLWIFSLGETIPHTDIPRISGMMKEYSSRAVSDKMDV